MFKFISRRCWHSTQPVKVLIFVTFLATTCVELHAQSSQNTLYKTWLDKSQHDTVRMDALYLLIWNGYVDAKPDSALYFAQVLYDFAKTKQHKIYMVRALTCQGLAFLAKDEYSKSLHYLTASLKLSKEANYKKGIAGSLTNLGLMYNSQGANSKALDYLLQGLKIHEEIGNKNGISICLGSLGTIYMELGEIEKALEYYDRSLALEVETNDKPGIAGSYNDQGRVFQHRKEYTKALESFEKGLAIMDEIQDNNGKATLLSNMGVTYVLMGDNSKALDYYQQALEIHEQVNNNGGVALVSTNIGLVYNKTKQHALAQKWCTKGLKAAERSTNINYLSDACECLYYAYKALGNGNEALLYHERMLGYQNAIKNEETGKKLQQMEFAKQALADSLATAEKERVLKEAHQNEVNQKNKTRNILLSIGALILLLAGSLYARLRYVRKSRADLQVEKDRSENLLLNILPEEIAQELKIYGKAEAKDFDMVSILFTDFKDFTEASAKLSAQDLVTEINTCFETFDGIMAKFGIEKIKTIGDSYMAAGGLPVPTDDSVKNTVLAALEMQAFIVERHKLQVASGNSAFEMRVGIHTGPVVAGIVGVKKFQYDIWGDTVNTASRMESAGEVGKVNISKATYQLLQHVQPFEFEYRGMIEAKGKGAVEMYFVTLRGEE